jgi:diguanylate cyclase (GGDEF)-like protein
MLDQSYQQKTPLSLIMLDIDYFKKLNDTYGHALGDKALQAFANTLQNHLRPADLLGRLGGEEFAVLLPNTAETEALAIAQTLRQQISQIELEHNQQFIQFTVSLGVVESNRESANIDALLAQADKALYVSKDKGRNQVTAYSEIDHDLMP